VGALFGFLAVIFFFIGHAQVKVLDHYPIHQVVLIRAFGALVFCLPYLYFKSVSILGNNKKILLLRGITGSMALFLYFTNLQMLPLSHAILLQQLAPLLALFISHFLLKETSSPLVYALFIISFLGIYLLKDPHSSWSIYYLFGICAATCSALAYNFVRKLRETDHPLVVVSYFQFCLVPACLVGFLFYGGVLPVVSDVRAILLLAFFSFLAQVCLTLAYHKTPVSKASSFNFLAIPLSAVVGYFFFDEFLSLQQSMGIILVLVCVLVNLFVINKEKTFKTS